MSDKTEEGQVDINVVKAALLKLLQDIEEKPDREDIKSLIHDTWKSIQLENTCECMALFLYFILMASLFLSL